MQNTQKMKFCYIVKHMVKIHKTLTTTRLFDIIINRKLRPHGQMFVLIAKKGNKIHVQIVAFDQ